MKQCHSFCPDCSRTQVQVSEYILQCNVFMQTVYCMRKVQIIFLHMHVVQYEHLQWKSLVRINTYFVVGNVRISVRKLQLPAPRQIATRDLGDSCIPKFVLCPQKKSIKNILAAIINIVTNFLRALYLHVYLYFMINHGNELRLTNIIIYHDLPLISPNFPKQKSNGRHFSSHHFAICIVT